ncbi:MAG: SRPBCC family protein [Acidobacteriota bacterium]|nr:SRPBCC family protein [Acidobacteriota bacterium]
MSKKKWWMGFSSYAVRAILILLTFIFSALWLLPWNLQSQLIQGQEKRQGQMQQQQQELQEQRQEQQKKQEQEQLKEQQEVKEPEQREGQIEDNSSPVGIPDFGPDGLKGLTEDQLWMVKADKIVLTASPEVTPDGHSVIAAAVRFRVPVEQVWQILSATERQIEYLDEIKRLKLVEQGEGFNRMEFEVKTAGQNLRYTVIHHFMPDKYYFWWELDEKAPHDLKALSGFWRLYPDGKNRTIGRYGSRVVPGFPLPGFIRTSIFKNGVHSSLEKVKAYVEKNASSE